MLRCVGRVARRSLPSSCHHRFSSSNNISITSHTSFARDLLPALIECQQNLIPQLYSNHTSSSDESQPDDDVQLDSDNEVPDLLCVLIHGHSVDPDIGIASFLPEVTHDRLIGLCTTKATDDFYESFVTLCTLKGLEVAPFWFSDEQPLQGFHRSDGSLYSLGPSLAEPPTGEPLGVFMLRPTIDLACQMTEVFARLIPSCYQAMCAPNPSRQVDEESPSYVLYRDGVYADGVAGVAFRDGPSSSDPQPQQVVADLVHHVFRNVCSWFPMSPEVWESLYGFPQGTLVPSMEMLPHLWGAVEHPQPPLPPFSSLPLFTSRDIMVLPGERANHITLFEPRYLRMLRDGYVTHGSVRFAVMLDEKLPTGECLGCVVRVCSANDLIEHRSRNGLFSVTTKRPIVVDGLYRIAIREEDIIKGVFGLQIATQGRVLNDDEMDEEETREFWEAVREAGLEDRTYGRSDDTPESFTFSLLREQVSHRASGEQMGKDVKRNHGLKLLSSRQRLDSLLPYFKNSKNSKKPKEDRLSKFA